MIGIGEIISNAIKYPSSDWKKILILGILLLIANVSNIISPFDAASLAKTNLTLYIILIIVLIIPVIISALLSSGYSLRIIKSSIAGVSELPEFDAWGNMAIDGLKLGVATFIYMIPFILIAMVAAVLAGVSGSGFAVVLVGFIIAFLYLLIVLPILAMALANMAYYDEFGAAFRFSEIFDKIRSITWGNLIKWYLAMIGISIVFSLIILVVSFLLTLINPILALVVSYLLFSPYFNMFLARSVGLEYISDEPN